MTYFWCFECIEYICSSLAIAYNQKAQVEVQQKNNRMRKGENARKENRMDIEQAT